MADTEKLCYVDARTGALSGNKKMKKKILFLTILFLTIRLFADEKILAQTSTFRQ